MTLLYFSLHNLDYFKIAVLSDEMTASISFGFYDLPTIFYSY